MMESDELPLGPGEVALEEDGEAAPAPDPGEGVEAAVDAAAAPEAENEPAQDAAVTPPPRRSGMKEELIEYRTRARQLERQFQELAPVLQHLTPDIQAALLEGRIAVKPVVADSAAEEAQLLEIAEKFRLTTPGEDGKDYYDLKAARDTRDLIERMAAKKAEAATAPVLQTHQDRAAADNLAKLEQHMSAKNMPDALRDTIREHFRGILSRPGGSRLIADSAFASQAWEQALGKAAVNGTLTPGPGAAGQPAPVVTPAGTSGRRSPAAALRLSPQLERVYREHGVTPTATSRPVNLAVEGVELE